MHAVKPKSLSPRAYHERKAQQAQRQQVNSHYQEKQHENTAENNKIISTPVLDSQENLQVSSPKPSWFSRFIQSFKQFYSNLYLPSQLENNKIDNEKLTNQTLLLLDSQTMFRENMVHGLSDSNTNSNTTIIQAQTMIEAPTLPDSLQAQVQAIHLLHNHIEKHYTRIDAIERHNANRLVQERLPQYIADFLLMKKEYRTSLVNTQGKNAQTLLEESLANISTHLQQIEMRANEAQLKELSVAARYTEAQL